MSELSVKYCDHENSDKFFFITRDIEYKKITIYQNGKVVKTLSNAEDLERGIDFKDSLGQEVSVQLVNKRIFLFSVIVNGNAYIKTREIKEVEQIETYDGRQITRDSDIRSIAWFFVVLLVLQLMNVMFFSQNVQIPNYQDGVQDAYPIYFIQYMTIPIICYSICIYVLHDNKGWAFFLGLSVLLIFTILELYDFYLISIDRRVEYPYVILFSMIARTVILILLVARVSKVVENLRSSHSSSSDGMLDNT